MISGYVLYKYNRAVKLHFTTKKYNVFDYNGKTNGVSFENFLERNEYNIFNAIARKFETESIAIQFLVANYAYQNDPVYNIASSEKNFILWNKRKQSITNTFKNDMGNISLVMEKKSLTYEEMIDHRKDIPELFKMYLKQDITIESMHILNKLTPVIDKWSSTLELVWGKDLLIIDKLNKFVKYDEEVMRKILESTLLFTGSEL